MTWDSARNDFLARHKDDIIYHRQLLGEDMRMANAADLLLAQRQEDGTLVGARIETLTGSADLSPQQVSGLLHTLAMAAPTHYLNTYREES